MLAIFQRLQGTGCCCLHLCKTAEIKAPLYCLQYILAWFALIIQMWGLQRVQYVKDQRKKTFIKLSRILHFPLHLHKRQTGSEFNNPEF